MKNIIFRANSSSTIGIGHIMRNLVLAKQHKDSKMIFATQDLEGNINHKIEEDGYIVELLKDNYLDEFYNITFKNRVNSALLLQSKTFDSKRIKYRLATLSEKEFNKLVKKFCDIVTPFSKEKGSD